MDTNKAINRLELLTDRFYYGEVNEALNLAIDTIKSQQKIIKKIDKAIESEKTTLDQFTDDFNHHLWIMRGLQVAKAIIEGKDYKDFIS